jgi:hypothetical protein
LDKEAGELRLGWEVGMRGAHDHSLTKHHTHGRKQMSETKGWPVTKEHARGLDKNEAGWCQTVPNRTRLVLKGVHDAWAHVCNSR